MNKQSTDHVHGELVLQGKAAKQSTDHVHGGSVLQGKAAKQSTDHVHGESVLQGKAAKKSTDHVHGDSAHLSSGCGFDSLGPSRHRERGVMVCFLAY